MEVLLWTLRILQELQIINQYNSVLPLSFSDKIKIMGVINITPDSFSDGGLYLNPKDAFIKALDCINSGADILDIGGQSTRPGSHIISPDEEIKRMMPALKSIRKEFPDKIISVDTFYSKVAKEALDAGANWINDISGGRLDPHILDILADSNNPFVVTHSRGNSQTMNNLSHYQNVIDDVLSELMIQVDKAIKAGISSKQIIIDPGIGFAKNTKQNLEILCNLESFLSIGFPVLVGPSRKRFIGDILNEPDPLKRLFGTASVVCKCVQSKINYIRLHDVYEMKQVIKMSTMLWT